MTGKTHVACSATAVAVLALAHPDGYRFAGVDVLPWVGVLSSVVGALLPDIDIPQSRLGQKFKFLSKNLKHRGITHTLLVPLILAVGVTCMGTRKASIIASLMVGILIGMLYDERVNLKRGNIIEKIKNLLVNKKGLTATIVMVILSYTVPETGASILWGLMVGWVLHIFEDLFNFKGCPIMYPFSKKHIHIASFKTRHWSEFLFFFLWEGVFVLWALLIVGGR